MEEDVKLKVKPEGRDGIWLAEKKNVCMWLRKQDWTHVHNFIGNGPVFMGADWDVQSVIDCIKRSDRLAVTTGDAKRQNLNHGLAVITGERLDLFDIGNITEEDLKIETHTPKA